MTRLRLVIDVTKCSGCYNCFLACRDEHFGNEYPGYSAAQPLSGLYWMKVNEIERGTYPQVQARLRARRRARTASRRPARRRPGAAPSTGARTASS